MIRSKDRRQKELMDFIPWGTERHHKMLKCSICHTFRKDILPNIPIHFFSKHFSEEFGRPTKDLQSIVGLFILQSLRDMTDLEAIEAYCLNDGFRYAWTFLAANTSPNAPIITTGRRFWEKEALFSTRSSLQSPSAWSLMPRSSAPTRPWSRPTWLGCPSSNSSPLPSRNSWENSGRRTPSSTVDSIRSCATVICRPSSPSVRRAWIET